MLYGMPRSFFTPFAKETDECWCNVDLFEARTKTFILRFWREPSELSNVAVNWRGMIEHIPSGERHYFHRIEDLPKLILPYLKETESNLSSRKSIWRRLITYHRKSLQAGSKDMPNGSQRSIGRLSLNFWLSTLREWWQRHHR
jgi:hypothetical protein